MDRKHSPHTTPIQPSQSPTAILVIHFGTSYADTRRHTIDATTRLIAQTFPQLACREAWTSRRIINKLKAQGEVHATPTEAMNKLVSNGYRQLIVQPTFLLDGVEMEYLRREVEAMKDSFDEIRIGNPLLYSIEDFHKVCEALSHLYPSSDTQDEALVLAGHGTHTPATATYTMLEYMLHDTGRSNVFVGTIEGYPGEEELVRRIESFAPRRIRLAPLLFVAGDHAQNDIDTEWRQLFEQRGYEVDVQLRGLGEFETIRAIYLDHIRALLTEH